MKIKNMKYKKIILAMLKYLSLIIGALVIFIPILVVLFGSFKTHEEYLRTNPLMPPQSWLNFENFYRAFTEGNMLVGFFNTTIILLVSLTISVLIGTMVSYVLDRFDFKGKKLIIVLFLGAAIIPAITQQVATFRIINALGLYNSRLSAILLYSGTDIISVYIILQFIRSIPKSLDESAMLDGASYFTIYSKIILPLLKPAIATIVIIKGVNIYNDFYIPHLYMPKQQLATISTSLFRFKGPYGSSREIISAGVIIVLIPTLTLFLLLQKQIYSGITKGSVK